MKVIMPSFTSKIGKAVAVIAAFFVTQSSVAQDTLFDSASFEFGTGSKIRMARVGVQSDWDKRWLASNGRHLSGYWDATLAYWRGTMRNGVPGARQHIGVIGLTPVFRYQRDDKLGWYVEGGIGAHLMSETYNNNNDRLSTAFQFGDHIGIGYVTPNKWDLAVKVQHFSNGSIKKPNSGVDFLVVKASRRF
jgi:hypothetical protein